MSENQQECDFHVRVVGNVVVIELMGFLGGSGQDLRKIVKTQLDSGKRDFLLNCAGLSGANSTGIGWLVSSYLPIENVGGRFMLCEVGTSVRRILVVSHILDTGFPEFFESCEEGMRKLLDDPPDRD